MNPTLARLLELAHRTAAKFVELSRSTYARMRTIELDQPRAVTLCIALQLAVLLLLLIFSPPTPPSAPAVP
jgi:hypothetical protein